MTLVSFDGLTVPLDQVQDNPARYARQLERAKKAPGYAVCCCRSAQADKPLRLVIRRNGTLFHLARWPDDGQRHDARSCAFFSSASSSDKAGRDALDAIQHTPTGLNVKLDASLSVRTVARASRSSTDHPTSAAVRRAAPLLAFLQSVWLEAGLNVWAGAPARSWGVCNAQILAVLGEGKLNGKSMQDVLHVMRRYDETAGDSIVAEFDAFLRRITTSSEVSQRRLVIAELRSVDSSKCGFVLKFRQTHKAFFASKAVIDAAAESYRAAWAMIGDERARRGAGDDRENKGGEPPDRRSRAATVQHQLRSLRLELRGRDGESPRRGAPQVRQTAAAGNRRRYAAGLQANRYRHADRNRGLWDARESAIRRTQS